MVKKRIHVAHQLLFTTMTIYFFPFKKKYIVIAKKKNSEFTENYERVTCSNPAEVTLTLVHVFSDMSFCEYTHMDIHSFKKYRITHGCPFNKNQIDVCS